MSVGGIIALSVIGALILAGFITFFCVVPIKTWLTALCSKAHVSMSKLVSLKYRKIVPMEVVKPYIMATKAGLGIKLEDIETLFLSGANCEKVLSSLIFAKSANLNFSFEEAKALQFAGQDPLLVLQNAVSAKMLDIEVKAIAQDMIELIVKLQASVKINIKNVISGLSEDTIISRVKKKVVENIGLSPSHKAVLNAPHKLLTGVMDGKIDKDCTYSLLSLEVVHVDIGRDVGAELVAKNAQRDISIAQVEAERMKHAALIKEQQMKAKTEEMKAEVLQAEAEVPRAIADAIKEGRFSIMDYYKLMNMQADTAMRRAMTSRDEEPGGDDE